MYSKFLLMSNSYALQNPPGFHLVKKQNPQRRQVFRFFSKIQEFAAVKKTAAAYSFCQSVCNLSIRPPARLFVCLPKGRYGTYFVTSSQFFSPLLDAYLKPVVVSSLLLFLRFLVKCRKFFIYVLWLSFLPSWQKNIRNINVKDLALYFNTLSKKILEINFVC